MHGTKTVEISNESQRALPLEGAPLPVRVKLTRTNSSTQDALPTMSPTRAHDFSKSFNVECTMAPLEVCRAATKEEKKKKEA